MLSTFRATSFARSRALHLPRATNTVPVRYLGGTAHNCLSPLRRTASSTAAAATSSELSSSIDSTEFTYENNPHFVKRKVALVCSYVGTNYSGLQLDESSGLRFVESELRDALVKVGAIRTSNAASLSKIRWSRSSRTDKGVHAARIVISAKLELDPAWMAPAGHDSKHSSVMHDYSNNNTTTTTTGAESTVESTQNNNNDSNKKRHPKKSRKSKNKSADETIATSEKVPPQSPADYRFKQLVERLNTVLPEDIRVFSCVKINQGFHARESCSWRQYEYVMPADILVQPTYYPTATASDGHGTLVPARYSTNELQHAVVTLDNALRKMEGGHMFHNFNRIANRDLRKQAARMRLYGLQQQQRKHKKQTGDFTATAEGITMDGADGTAASPVMTREQQLDAMLGAAAGISVSDVTAAEKAVLLEMFAFDKSYEDPALSGSDRPLHNSSNNSSSNSNSSSSVDETTATSTSTTDSRIGSNQTAFIDANVEDDEDDSDYDGVVAAEVEVQGDTTNDSDNGTPLTYYENWQVHPKRLSRAFRGVVHRCRVTELQEINGRLMVVIRVRGAGFLLHQIRIMVGTAVAVARGVLPEDAIDIALEVPLLLNFPIAPAAGLFLDNAGFERNIRMVTMSQDTAVNASSDLFLLDQDEYENSLRFQQQRIRPRIDEDWRRHDSVVLKEWLPFCERFRPPEHVVAQWRRLHYMTQQLEEQFLVNKRRKELKRIAHNVENFQARLQQQKAYLDQQQRIANAQATLDDAWTVDGAMNTPVLSPSQKPQQELQLQQQQDQQSLRDASSAESGMGTADSDVKIPVEVAIPVPRNNKVPHRSFLPNLLHSLVAMQFDVVPGLRINEALRALATKVALGEIPADLTIDQLLQIICDGDQFDPHKYNSNSIGLNRTLHHNFTSYSQRSANYSVKKSTTTMDSSSSSSGVGGDAGDSSDVVEWNYMEFNKQLRVDHSALDHWAFIQPKHEWIT